MLKRHEERAVDFHLLAVAARKTSRQSALPRVRELHEQAAARWEVLARLEKQFARRRLARLALAPARLTGLPNAGPAAS